MPATGQPLTYGRKPIDDIVRILQSINEGHYLSTFRGWIAACNIAIDDLPCHLHFAATGQSIADPERNRRWKEEVERCFKPSTIDKFAQAFAVLVMNTEPIEEYYHGDMGRIYGPDIVGAVYMDMLTGRSNKWNYAAQYFTPWNVALMMARIVQHDGESAVAEFKRQVLDAIKDDPLLEAMSFAAGIVQPVEETKGENELKGFGASAFQWWAQHAWPLIKPKLRPITICEPAVGSGVMLLAAASCYPLWFSQIGFVQYFGQDIDALCVEMCRLNLKLYGITPVKLQSATLETLEEWLPKVDARLAEQYKQTLEAEASGDDTARASLVEGINQTRLEQASLFGDISPDGDAPTARSKKQSTVKRGKKESPSTPDLFGGD